MRMPTCQVAEEREGDAARSSALHFCRRRQRQTLRHHVFAVSTLHDLPADRHNDPWKFAVVGVNENGPLYRTDTGFFED